MDKQRSHIFINEIENKEEIANVIISELREHGIKYRKEKRIKVGQEKNRCKKIFNVPLHTLELTDVILANGYVAQIPAFVSNACQRVLEQIKTEGLFRKAGSAKRQQEIKASIESGKALGKSYHVIDIANILKTFFRDLPEPLLPTGSFQEALIRCLLSGEHKVYNLLITCLLLPPITINTLAFFMQFLHTVTLHSSCNKMTAENLAIIFTPNLMPIAEMIQQRLSSHVKVIQLLIENSHNIGVVPETVFDKINESVNIARSTVDSLVACNVTEKKKKKRRSGSITRIFHGIKKIVGAVGSSENLDNPDELLDKTNATPCLSKSSKKRKVADGMPFSAKKKREVISSLPDNHDILPYTPIAILKDVKKPRLSLGGHKTKGIRLAPSSTSISSVVDDKPMERRWSLVGAPWTRRKRNESTDKIPSRHNTEDDDESNRRKISTGLSPVTSLPNLTSPILEQEKEHSGIQTPETTFLKGRALFDDDNEGKNSSEQIGGEEYLKISKSEYEAIKERVAAIETRISQEFENIDQSKMDQTDILNSIDCITNKYNMTLKTTEPMEASNSCTDQLAKRLSRELKIRRNVEQCVMRSPSARKIGSLRRRSRENVRISRNQSWHLGSNVAMSQQPVFSAMSDPFYHKSNLRRGRPNTVQSGLKHPELSPVRRNINEDRDFKHVNTDEARCGIRWTNAENFFNNTVNLQKSIDTSVINTTQEIFKTPEQKTGTRHASLRSTGSLKTVFIETEIESSKIKTPMLPPEIPPRKTPGKPSIRPAKTPGPLHFTSHKDQLTPLHELQSGRASIARLRSQNAGMVLAKAKLFDGIVFNSKNNAPSVQKQANREQGAKLALKSTDGIYNCSSEDRRVTESIPLRVQKNASTVVNYNTKNQQRSTPRKRVCTKSPRGGINHREKLRLASKSVQSSRVIRQLQDEKTLKSDKRTNMSAHFSPNLYDLNNRTPHIKKNFVRNSPRRLVSKKAVNNRENEHFNPSVHQQMSEANSLQKLSLIRNAVNQKSCQAGMFAIIS
ncbi:uncharacterized protein LOC129717797 [Wyeomyia smithii]|uniref:uncharacterized protein LOC129717797 n=1 Tax=Wyeomyia smithii TaxID=174621 RepID=UPI00246807DC|nr:uncharacterized protein LOC129717797 [Wyeomyia smithii]